MKVRYTVSMAGPDVLIGAGQVADVDNALAKRLIEAGFAEPVREEPAPEGRKVSKTTRESPERSVSRD